MPRSRARPGVPRIADRSAARSIARLNSFGCAMDYSISGLVDTARRLTTRRKFKPLGECTKCQALTYVSNALYLGHGCGGEFLPAPYDACETCGTTGDVNGQSCAACGGMGWRRLA